MVPPNCRGGWQWKSNLYWEEMLISITAVSGVLRTACVWHIARTRQIVIGWIREGVSEFGKMED